MRDYSIALMSTIFAEKILFLIAGKSQLETLDVKWLFAERAYNISMPVKEKTVNTYG